MSGLARPEFLASTGWLADQAAREDIRVLDVRWRPDGTGRQVFAAGHIPGSVYLDWATELTDQEDGQSAIHLASPARIAAAMGRAGVGDGTTVVLYDDTLGLYAARSWWSLRAYGFDAVRILDGGYPAWTAERRPISNSALPPDHATFTPRARVQARLTTADVRNLLGSPEVLLLDSRAPAEYHGYEGNVRRLGHIPGALNVPVGLVVEPGSQRLKSPDQLRSVFHRAGVGRGRRIVCYDGSGIGATKLVFALTLLGHDDVAVYDGGWTEWGDRLDLPVER